MSDEDNYDPLNDLPASSRAQVVAAVKAALAPEADDDEREELDDATAEQLVRAAEPLWEVLDELGFVDTWGGMEFVHLFPGVLAFIRREVN